MTKLQIEGKRISYTILEIKNADALTLQSIMEKEYVTYNDIFFERKDFKKLGFKKLEDIPVVGHFSGFLSEPPSFLTPNGVFTLFRNKKKVFASTLDRLEERFHMGLYKEFCLLKSNISSHELSYRKRRGHKYFFLKLEQSGKFTSQFDHDLAIEDLIFNHTNLFKPKSNFYPVQLVRIMFDDSILEFSVGGKSEIKKSLEAIR
jgi:hypothetical protein